MSLLLPWFEGSHYSLLLLCPSGESVRLQTLHTLMYITRSYCTLFTLSHTLVQRETWRTFLTCTQSGHGRITDREALSPIWEDASSGVRLPLVSLCCPLLCCIQTCETIRPAYLKWQPSAILYPLPCISFLLSTTCMHLCSCLLFISPTRKQTL